MDKLYNLTMAKIHGHAAGGKLSRTYNSWAMMIARCTNPKAPNYARYGGAGIEVCERWRNSFSDFLSDMGERPDGCTLDRRDGNKGYYPENCRWLNVKEQQRNRKNNVWVEYEGRRLCASDAAREFGISKNTLAYRLKQGWPSEKLFSTPGRKG